jgi:hypothetical protein
MSYLSVVIAIEILLTARAEEPDSTEKESNDAGGHPDVIGDFRQIHAASFFSLGLVVSDGGESFIDRSGAYKSRTSSSLMSPGRMGRREWS